MTARTYESLASAAARMGASVKTVRRRIADGVLPVYRCGRILRLDPNDVDGMFCRYPQEALLNADLLRRVWPQLRLPKRCRHLWEARLPELLAS